MGTITALNLAGMVCLQTENSAAVPAPIEGTRSWLQRFLLGSYGLLARTRLPSTAFGRAVFAAAYEFYKSRWEAPGIIALKPFARPGTVVIDVGANIGFFTRRFSEWVRPGGLVFAVEPEADNFKSLNAMLSRRGLLNVEPIQAVAADCNGTLKLQINPLHPADHRIAETGAEVRSLTLDSLLHEKGWADVSLIKIDVQGAEERVLAGAAEILSRFQPALYIEVDDAALKQMRSSAERVFALLSNAGYAIHRIEDDKASSPLSGGDALKCSQSSNYSDFLFVAQR